MASMKVVFGSSEDMRELRDGRDARRLRSKLRQEIEKKLNERGR